MDFSEIAEDDFSSLGVEFGDDEGGTPPVNPGGAGPRPRLLRGGPPLRRFRPRGHQGPPPRFMGPGSPRQPFPPNMRNPVRGMIRPPFPLRPGGPGERGRPPFRRPRKPPPPQRQKIKKEINEQKPGENPPVIEQQTPVPETQQPTQTTPANIKNEPIEEVNKELAIEDKSVSDSKETDEDALLLEESGSETNDQVVDLDDAVSIHGDEEFEIEKDHEEKTKEKSEENEVASTKKDDTPKVDKKQERVENRSSWRPQRDFNRGRGRGNYHRGRGQHQFRAPSERIPYDHGPRPFPSGQPNFPPLMHPPKNIHVNPRFMGPRPAFEGTTLAPSQLPFHIRHPSPSGNLPARGAEMMVQPSVHQPARRFPDPSPNYQPVAMPLSHDMTPRHVTPAQNHFQSQHQMRLPTTQVRDPINPAVVLRGQSPMTQMVHPGTQYNHGLTPGIQATPLDPRITQVPPAFNTQIPRTAYDVDRMYASNRVNDRADLTALYNSQAAAAYMTRQQQYPAQATAGNIQQMYDWQQQLRREPNFDQGNKELPKTKHSRERNTRSYSDHSDGSSRSRSPSFSDSRSYSRSPSRSWSNSPSPSLSRSWSKSLSRSRSRSPVIRSRSPRREIRISKEESPVRRVERSNKRVRETRRETKKERGRHVERSVVNDNERLRDRTPRRESRQAQERTRTKERTRENNERVRGTRERGQVSNRTRERGRNVENEGRSRTGGSTRRVKREEKDHSRGTNRRSRRSSTDKKSTSTTDAKSNRVVATKSSSSGKPSNRIVIGSLPDSITPSKLKELLASIGPIEQLKMSTTKHKALVTFETNEHALACRRKFHRAKVDDSQITVDFL